MVSKIEKEIIEVFQKADQVLLARDIEFLTGYNINTIRRKLQILVDCKLLKRVKLGSYQLRK